MNDHREMELTVGWGNLFAIFFGIVILCALFFGWGFKIGLKSAASAENINPAASKSAYTVPVPKPSAVRAVRDDAAPVGSASVQSAPADEKPPVAPVKSATPVRLPAPEIKPVAGNGNFVVQVAAVSRQEDAGALVNALLKKNYPVFVLGNVPGDKLFHIQVGPFATLKDAETMRSRLAGDGYNPILKK